MLIARSGLVAATALALATVVEPPAHAYLDPASGSMLLQLVLGGVAGAAVAVKLIWHRIRGLGRRDTQRPR
jgi:hypothetical protein